MALRLEDKKGSCQRGEHGCGRICYGCCSGIQGSFGVRNDGVAYVKRVMPAYTCVLSKTRWRVVPSRGPNLSACRTRSKDRFCSRSQKTIQVLPRRVIKNFAKEHNALQAVSLSAGGQL